MERLDLAPIPVVNVRSRGAVLEVVNVDGVGDNCCSYASRKTPETSDLILGGVLGADVTFKRKYNRVIDNF